MVILVVGGSENLSRQVVNCFLENEHKVIFLDNLSIGRLDAVDPSVVYCRMDIKEERRLEELFNAFNIDAVIHLGSYADELESLDEPLKYYEYNIGGIITLLKVMKRHRVQFLVFSSSAPSEVITPYSESMRMVESILARVDTAHHIKSMILRRSNAFEDDHVVKDMAKAFLIALKVLMEQ